MVVTKRFVDGTLQVADFSGHSPLFRALPEPHDFRSDKHGHFNLEYSARASRGREMSELACTLLSRFRDHR